MRSLAFRDNNRRRCACGTRDFGTPPGRGAPMKSQRIIALVKPVGGADWVSFWLESALQLLFRTAAGSKTNRHKGIQERPRRGASRARGRSTNVGQVPVRIRRRNGACHHLLRRGPDLDRNRRHDSLDPGPSDGRPRHPRLIFNGSRVRAGSPRKTTTNSSPRVEHPPPVLKKKAGQRVPCPRSIRAASQNCRQKMFSRWAEVAWFSVCKCLANIFVFPSCLVS